MTGTFMWMADIARALREGLRDDAGKVAQRVLPDALVRVLALAMPELRCSSDLGQGNEADNGKAKTLLGFVPRPVEETILECGRSLLGRSKGQAQYG